MSTLSTTAKINIKDQLKLKQKHKSKQTNMKLNDVLPYIVNSLEEIILYNETEEVDSLVCDNSPFFFNDLPEISISEFLRRIIKYSRIETSTLIIMSMYIDRYCDQCSYYISNYSIYR